ncbi:MAG: glycosyltransferase, partial [Actinobacteria bacterium]|nr:glycosyltransferase [Actinomycetota bacterium]
PETMGGAGVLFTVKDCPLLAEFLDRLGRDAFLLERIKTAQRERLQEFSEERFAARLREVLGRVISEKAEVLL